MLKVGLRPASALFNYKARHSDPLSHSGTEGIAVPAKAIAAAFALQPRHGLDAYWPLALLTACALALAGCSTGSHALDSKTQAEAQPRATAKPPPNSSAKRMSRIRRPPSRCAARAKPRWRPATTPPPIRPITTFRC